MTGAGHMDLHFNNCGSCESATLTLNPGALNIKYGSNGVGKSTMAKALKLQIRGESLLDLLPFKERSKPVDKQAQPSVSGCEKLKTLMVFDEAYVEQFVFAPDELVQNSFEIFVRTPDYDARMDEIETRLKAVKEAFQDNEELAQMLADLSELARSFGQSQSGIAKNGRLYKAIGSGNKIDNVPDSLKPFSPFLTGESNVAWIKWQIEGNEFSDIADDGCPYCVASIADRKDMIDAVSQEYDAKSVEHLVALKAVLQRLGSYFDDKSHDAVARILRNKTALSTEEQNFLKEIRSQVETLHAKLSQLQTISFFDLRDVEDLDDAVSDLKIDMSLLGHLASKRTLEIVDKLNSKTDSVLEEIGLLKGAVAKHRVAIEKTVEAHSSAINAFLQRAGYPYVVEIVPGGDAYKLRLRHVDHAEHIQGGQNHLSFGERNALSLVLFMYECLRQKPELVVLDDPISSFDKHKKFAVMDMLFRGSSSLRGITTLLLTHDIEPVIDAGKTLRHTFNPVPSTAFLRSRAGKVTEKEIEPSDLITFAQICKENIASEVSRVVKAIYLRRHFEIVDDRGLSYHLLSSLLKARPVPTILEGSLEAPMTQKQQDQAITAIHVLDASFDYGAGLAEVADRTTLRATYQGSSTGYDKLQLFRCLVPAPGDNVLAKYVNETYHVENDHIVQLNPRKFDAVPEHIIEACDTLVNQAQ